MGRTRILVTIGATALVAGLWAPALLADRYADGPGGAEVHAARIDHGWRFLVEAVHLSRGAALGDDADALTLARRIWSGPAARASSVRLTYMDGPFAAPVPPGGDPPPAGRRMVRPRSDLSWVVTGTVRRGTPQVIGLLDYHSGAIAWDIRPRLRSGG